MGEKKREVRRLRRRFQQEKGEEDRRQARERYKQIRREYKQLISERRSESFIKFCEEKMNSNPWSLPYKIIANKRNTNNGKRYEGR